MNKFSIRVKCLQRTLALEVTPDTSISALEHQIRCLMHSDQTLILFISKGTSFASDSFINQTSLQPGSLVFVLSQGTSLKWYCKIDYENREVDVACEGSITVQEAVERAAMLLGISEKSVFLTSGSKILAKSESVPRHTGCRLRLLPQSQIGIETKINVEVKTMMSHQKYFLQISTGECVLELKKRLTDQCGAGIEIMRIIFAARSCATTRCLEK